MGKRTKDLSIVVSLRTLVAFRALYAVVALSSREVRFLNQRHKILPSAFAEAIAGRANKTMKHVDATSLFFRPYVSGRT